jgi:hypothetical protein
MAGVIGIIALLTVLGLSLAITRLATIALAMTGLSYEAARFQARSAFTGTGFTTSESEQIVTHPVRRRIVMMLMTVRSAGLITVVLSLILSFVEAGGAVDRLERMGYLLAGVATLWLVARSRLADRLITRAMTWALDRYTDLDTRDYAGLLRLTGNYRVMEVRIRDGEWLDGKKVRDCRLADEGVNILGITRENGEYVGVPRADTELHEGDTLILYGREATLKELDKRRSGAEGDREHDRAVSEETGRAREQERKERAHEVERSRRKAP